ncbi:MAG: hypothetical protein LBH19_06925 [Dysgonamonadaceae bacterium]|jgi:hypothetical protein|nr:hypothetical protein [Dysgonamonadaceae bacterium]
MDTFQKNKGRQSRVSNYLPHRQLFKPENIVESIFVGLSVCSVLVIILANIVNIDSTLKVLAPKFVAQNFQEIMHFLHILLILYVLFEMRKLYEDIRETRPVKDAIKEACKKETNLTRWQHWIKENIDVRKEEKEVYGCYRNNPDEKTKDDCINRMNYRIKIANANMKMTHTLWMCVWASWLLIYIGLFSSGFQKQTFEQKTEKSRIAISITDRQNQTYYVKSFYKNDEWIVSGRPDTVIIRDGGKGLQKKEPDTVLYLSNVYPTADSDIVFSKLIRDSLLAYKITKEIPPVFQQQQDEENADEKEKLKQYFMFGENTLGHIINLAVFLMFFMYQFAYSGTLIFPELKRRKNTGEIIKESPLARGLYWLYDKFLVIREAAEDEKLGDELFKKELKNTNNFILFCMAVCALTSAFILIDGRYLTLKGHKDNVFYAQLLVSAMTCVSMMLLFAQTNNGKLRLPGSAIAVMFFYAAVQLFSPFRNTEIVQPIGFLNTHFDFLVTTLCFIAKFMVFFIIRWMFTGGRLAYNFIDTAIKSHPETKTNEKKEYELIFD